MANLLKNELVDDVGRVVIYFPNNNITIYLLMLKVFILVDQM
jgi:hypothetical protein